MNNLSKHFEKLINEEIISINKKLNGTIFLDLLKENLIQKININDKKSYIEQFQNLDFKIDYEDDIKKIEGKIISAKSPKMLVNSILQNNLLLINLKESINVILEDHLSKKKFNIRLIPFTGISMPKNSKCTLNFDRNSVILEILLNEKNINIENLKENTI